MNRPIGTYDSIGAGYTRTRRPDPKHRTAIMEMLGDARSVVNVGAGTGSYRLRQTGERGHTGSLQVEEAVHGSLNFSFPRPSDSR